MSPPASTRPLPSRWSIMVEWCAGSWSDWKALFSLTQNNFTVRFCCVLLMLKCSFVALTGRGVVSIIQAILGVIFSIEGFWGAVKYDPSTIKRFLIFLVVYFLVSIGIAIINLQTLRDYCSSALNEDDQSSCLSTAELNSYILLGLSLGLVPAIFGVGVIFYMSIQSAEANGAQQRRRKGLTGYEMAEIGSLVDRIGFSTDR